jgi:hypothetical protein
LTYDACPSDASSTNPAGANNPFGLSMKDPNIERINTMPDNYGNGGGYPSTTGKPSGGGRSNGPRGK